MFIEDFAACFAGIIFFGLGLIIESINLEKMKTSKSFRESRSSQLLMIILPVLAYYVLLSMAQGFAG